jgi:hypothetical protein
MPANLWKSLTVRFMTLGHSLREAECMAAVIVIDCLVMYTIMGYRFSDAERERPPSFFSGPETRPVSPAGHCGTVPAGVGRDGILLQCQPGPARPYSGRERDGIPGMQGTSPAVTGTAARVYG